MQKNMGSIRQAQFFGEKICSNNLVNKPQPLCCIHAIRTQAHANPCINSISFYFYFVPSQFLCQRLRVFGYSFVCWTWENTATHYYVYMIIMAVYIQHSEIVDPFYIESHRHQIEVKYNIIKPSSLCVLFFFVLAAKIKSAGKKIHRIIMDETFFFFFCALIFVRKLIVFTHELRVARVFFLFFPFCWRGAPRVVSLWRWRIKRLQREKALNAEDLLRDKQDNAKTPNDCNILEDNIVSARHRSLYGSRTLVFAFRYHKQIHKQQYILIIYTVVHIHTELKMSTQKKRSKKNPIDIYIHIKYIYIFEHFSLPSPTFTS